MSTTRREIATRGGATEARDTLEEKSVNVSKKLMKDSRKEVGIPVNPLGEVSADAQDIVPAEKTGMSLVDSQDDVHKDLSKVSSASNERSSPPHEKSSSSPNEASGPPNEASGPSNEPSSEANKDKDAKKQSDENTINASKYEQGEEKTDPKSTVLRGKSRYETINECDSDGETTIRSGESNPHSGEKKTTADVQLQGDCENETSSPSPHSSNKPQFQKYKKGAAMIPTRWTSASADGRKYDDSNAASTSSAGVTGAERPDRKRRFPAEDSAASSEIKTQIRPGLGEYNKQTLMTKYTTRNPTEPWTNLKQAWKTTDMPRRQFRSRSPALDKNYLFFTNQIRSKPDGDFIDDIHKRWWGNYGLLERHHGFIQWLFPIKDSGMNFHAQVLQADEIKAIREDKRARERLVCSYKMMLDFYGMRLVDKDSGEVARAGHWRVRFAALNHSYHNYLRITRILKCLGLLGFERFQVPFLIFVLGEILLERTLSNAATSCTDYWIGAVADQDQREELFDEARRLKREGKSRRRRAEAGAEETADVSRRSSRDEAARRFSSDELESMLSPRTPNDEDESKEAAAQAAVSRRSSRDEAARRVSSDELESMLSPRTPPNDEDESKEAASLSSLAENEELLKLYDVVLSDPDSIQGDM